MLNLTEEQKKMFYSDKYSYNYTLHFADIDLNLDNEQLHSEEVTLNESICDSEDLTLGGCIASSMEFCVSEIAKTEIAGLTFSADIEVKNESGEIMQTVPMGVFIVDNPEQTNNSDKKTVVAYDRMYETSVDVSEWYNNYFADDATHTVKDTRESLLDYLAIPFVTQNLTNDDVSLSKTIEPNGNLKGVDVLRQLCTINGGFGRMNRNGEFEVIHLSGLGIFPEETLYPSEDLYPEDGYEYIGLSSDDYEKPEYRNIDYSEYITQPISCLKIQTDEEDAGEIIGTDVSNPYVIASNIFLFGKSSKEIQTIGANIFAHIKGVQYRPHTVQLCGLPYIACGDSFVAETDGIAIESFVFSRTLSGIQSLVDTYYAKGNKIRDNEVSANDEIVILKAKTLKISKTIDGFSIVLDDLENNTNSKLEQTSDSLNAVIKAITKEWDLKDYDQDQIVEGEGSPYANELLPSDYQDCYYLDNQTGYLWQAVTAGSHTNWNVVDQLERKLVNLQSQIEQTNEKISSKVEKDEIVSEINQSSELIELKGKRIIIESDLWSVDEDGKMICKDITISGGTIIIDSTMEEDNRIALNLASSEDENVKSENEISADGIFTSETLARERTTTMNYGRSSTRVYGNVINMEFAALSKTAMMSELNETDCVEGNLEFVAIDEYSDKTPEPVLKTPFFRTDVPFVAPNIQSGRTSVTPDAANVPTKVHIDFDEEFAFVPNVTVTPVTTVPGTGVLGVSIQNVGTTGFDVFLTRKDTTTTGVHWIAIGNMT